MGWLLVRSSPPWMRLVLGSLLFDLSLVGWPISLWVTNEPPYILSLSWLALTLTGWDILQTADVRKEQDDG